MKRGQERGKIDERIIKSLLDGSVKSPTAIANEYKQDRKTQLQRYVKWCNELHEAKILYLVKAKKHHKWYKLEKDKAPLIEYVCKRYDKKDKLKLTNEERGVLNAFFNHHMFLKKIAPLLEKHHKQWEQQLVFTLFQSPLNVGRDIGASLNDHLSIFAAEKERDAWEKRYKKREKKRESYKKLFREIKEFKNFEKLYNLKFSDFLMTAFRRPRF